MRYGVLSDVHGNLHALEAVLEALERESVDAFICAGDVVGYGPRPNECVALIESLGHVLAVAGNHDLMALGRLPDTRLGRLAAVTLQWTRSALDDRSRAWLEALPVERRTADGVVVAHGSLDDPSEYVRDCGAGATQLETLSHRDPDAVGLVLGHTHHPLACSAAGELPVVGPEDLDLPSTWLLNPGSVGQARERRPLARALVLDRDRRAARFLAVEYDVAATRRELRAGGLPPHACHIAPGRPARWRRRLISRL